MPLVTRCSRLPLLVACPAAAVPPAVTTRSGAVRAAAGGRDQGEKQGRWRETHRATGCRGQIGRASCRERVYVLV